MTTAAPGPPAPSDGVPGTPQTDASPGDLGIVPAAAELVARISWLIKLRWVAIAGATVAVLFVTPALGVTVSTGPILAVMAALAAYNLLLAGVGNGVRDGRSPGGRRGFIARTAAGVAVAPVHLLRAWFAVERPAHAVADLVRPRRESRGPRRRRTLEDLLVPRELWGVKREDEVYRAAAIAAAQINTDLVALAALLHFSGGVENPFIYFSVFHVVIASILLSRPATYLEASFGFALIATVSMAELEGFIPHVALGLLPLAPGATFVAAQLAVLGATLFLTAYMASSISAHQRSYEREAALLAGDVARKAEQLGAAFDRVRRAERAKSQYMRKVAHELKGPLGAVQMMLRVVLDGLAGEIPERSRDLVARAERRTGELAGLTQDLLALSRIREGAAAVEPSDVSLSDLVAEVAADARGAAERVGVALVVEIATATARVRGDETGLRQLVANLVSNAIRYTPSDGTVTVRLQADVPTIVLRVEDTGIGIPKGELPRIFEEFYRAGNARAHTSDGTGLGLSIVKAVAEQHGGTVGVESEAGRGTAFTVRLPAETPARG